ncbi:hypothetical protein Pcinc_035007 [Petrolisthes cinctipes]|uniref:Uncharacterized protein n=1 Tax=Petrolisthes cinctipes TaxID=88211 RepID=A0AAE1BXP5_PETCI|nr:hypothetical protein Pcinc_035007 [Petrolisthes cinctipes]
MGILTGIKGDQFTTAFTGISPTTRPLTREDLYGQQQQGLPDGFLQGPGGLMHRPGVHSPTEMRGGVMVTTSGMVKSLDRPRQTSLFGIKKNKSLRPDLGETWPCIVDLSPIMDVSPSVEAAEQEANGRKDAKGSPNVAGAAGQQKSSISGMLSDFTRALGLGGTSPKDEHKGNIVTSQHQPQQQQQLLTSQAQAQGQLITSQGTTINSQGQLVNSQGQIVAQVANHVSPSVQASVVGAQVANNPTVVVSAGQPHPLPFQQMTPAQQLQLQQMQLQHQAQHLKKMRRQDQAAALQQQLLTQGKVSPTPPRKDVTGGLQQLAGKMVGRVATSLPTAALLQQSTIATSDSKPRVLVMPGHPTASESPLTSLQR